MRSVIQQSVVPLIVSVAFIVAGGWILIRPAAAIRLNNGVAPAAPPGRAQIRRMRIAGAVFLAAGIYGLYAQIAGLPGAEFFPV